MTALQKVGNDYRFEDLQSWRGLISEELALDLVNILIEKMVDREGENSCVPIGKTFLESLVYHNLSWGMFYNNGKGKKIIWISAGRINYNDI